MIRKYLFCFVLLFYGLLLCAKVDHDYTVVFYNCENLFDVWDDPHTNDNEFLPNGRRNWTKHKFDTKIQNISKVFLAIETTPPAIIGLAEVENKFVIEQLVYKTGLVKYNYQIVHQDSFDPRGIDVAAIYRPNIVQLLKYNYIRVDKPGNSLRTRDILYMMTKLGKDTIHIFFNHWPSRRGKPIQTEQNRITIAKILRHKIDSLFHLNPLTKILIMGDFNDEPDNISIQRYLKAVSYSPHSSNIILYNLSYNWLKNVAWLGTYKYKNKWNIFDLIIVSPAFSSFNPQNHNCLVVKAEIFSPNFLLINDERYGGIKPFKGFNGLRWVGGFSDHLPIVAYLRCN